MRRVLGGPLDERTSAAGTLVRCGEGWLSRSRAAPGSHCQYAAAGDRGRQGQALRAAPASPALTAPTAPGAGVAQRIGEAESATLTPCE